MGRTVRGRVERFGIPVDSHNPRCYYIVCLSDESRGPTVDELVLIRLYRDYIIHRFYNEQYVRTLVAQKFPAVGGHNTTIFKKNGPRSWVYRKLTWNQGPLYVPVDKDYRQVGIPLPALLDRSEAMGTDVTDENLTDAYHEFRSSHPKYFAPLVAAPVA
jgi:hypothetical protein